MATTRPSARRLSAVIADNRKAFHDYHVLDTWEAGVALLGTEVKSIREGRVNLRDSYARLDKGEVWLLNVHISPYSHRGSADHERAPAEAAAAPPRDSQAGRASIVERGLYARAAAAVPEEGPREGRCALVKGKQEHDKRETIRRREVDRETRAAVKARSRLVERFLLFPLLAPAVLLAAGNDAFGFDPPGYLDSFVYVGYFWHYPEHLWVFDDNSNYKISRLPWILPGYVLHALAGPIVASYVLAYVTLALGAVALFLLVKDASTIAEVPRSSVSLGLLHLGSRNGGWNYQVLIASGYYLMTCWLVVRAARGRSPGRAALLAGGSGRRGSHPSVPRGLCAARGGAHHRGAAGRGREKDRAQRRAAGLVVAGRPCADGCSRGHQQGHRRRMAVLQAQVEQAMRVTNPDYDHWWKGNASQWLPAARYLVMPIAAMAAGLGALFVRHDERSRRMSLTLVGLAWAAFVIMCYFQLARRLTTLDYSYVAFALYPHAFACLAVAFADEKRGAWTATVSAVIIVGTLACSCRRRCQG